DKVIADWGMWAKPAANGQLDHPSRIFLVDAGGRIREIYNLDFLRVPWVVQDIESLVKEAASPPQALAERANKVLIVGIDGCRTDALLKAKAPHLHGLIRSGAFSESTRVLPEHDTGVDTSSGPGWSAILTGVWADKHRVRDNSFEVSNYIDYPHFFQR